MMLELAAAIAGFGLVASISLAKTVIDLSGSDWTLTNQQGNVSIPGTVPSHAHLDLYAAGVINDPLYGAYKHYLSSTRSPRANAISGDNSIFDNWVATSNWTYTSHPISGL